VDQFFFVFRPGAACHHHLLFAIEPVFNRYYRLPVLGNINYTVKTGIALMLIFF
jgi:hypothetical protein